MAIHLRSAEELEKMHRAGLVVYETLTALRDMVRPGLTTMDLERFAEGKIAGRPGKAAFKGYRGYPCSLCTSVNSEIVHGIPSPKRKLREGDIVSIDFGMEVDGYFADSAVTVRGCKRAWSSPSSRWSMPAVRKFGCVTSGWRKRRMAAPRRTSSTPWRSPRTDRGS